MGGTGGTGPDVVAVLLRKGGVVQQCVVMCATSGNCYGSID
jgi:hypothetical protein